MCGVPVETPQNRRDRTMKKIIIITLVAIITVMGATTGTAHASVKITISHTKRSMRMHTDITRGNVTHHTRTAKSIFTTTITTIGM